MHYKPMKSGVRVFLTWRELLILSLMVRKWDKGENWTALNADYGKSSCKAAIGICTTVDNVLYPLAHKRIFP